MSWIYRPNHPKANSNGMVQRSEVHGYLKSAAPNVISDTMDPTRHMGSGQVIDSKAKFRAETRATGCVEIGNEPIRARRPVVLDKGQRREAIQKSIYQLRNG